MNSVNVPYFREACSVLCTASQPEHSPTFIYAPTSDDKVTYHATLQTPDLHFPELLTVYGDVIATHDIDLTANRVRSP
jgi:hypothetical protein